MDEQRFDDLIRALARCPSRRQVLKGLAGSVSAGMAILMGRSGAEAAAGIATCGNAICAGQPGICAAGCACCVWANGNSRCLTDRQCRQLGGTLSSDCAAGRFACDGNCVDAQTDPANCGSCENACPPSTNSCQVPVCTNGACGFAPDHDGTPCDDGNACASGATCQGGVCTDGAPVICTTDNPCLTASCDAALGCVTTPRAKGTVCDDGILCTAGAACDGAGNCVASGVVQCGDCQACDTGTGQCVADLDRDRQTCLGDGNRCYERFVCDSGSCVGIQPVQCVAQDSCHIAGTCDSTTGCSNPAAPNGTGCGAGQICINGTCAAGCYIDSTFYRSDDANPFNACQTCQPNISTTNWTVAGGAPCTISGINGACCAADGQCCGGSLCICCGGYACASPNHCIADECS